MPRRIFTSPNPSGHLNWRRTEGDGAKALRKRRRIARMWRRKRIRAIRNAGRHHGAPKAAEPELFDFQFAS